MRKLKTRTRADTLNVEPRFRPRRNWDRLIYLSILAVFFAGFGDYVAGDIIFLRADGLVVRDHSEIGADSLVRVTEVAVRPGEKVEAGDMLLRAESIDILGRLAELTMREAELVERGAQLKSDLALSTDLLPRAQVRLQGVTARQAEMDRLKKGRLISAERVADFEANRYAVEVEAATLSSRINGLKEEIAALDVSRNQAAEAVQTLKTRYSGGVHQATIAGVVGDNVPAPGEVLNPGETILTLYWGDAYVLAYLPKRYIFDIAVGDAVSVKSGHQVRAGHISAILPMSTAIPDEFRNAFKLNETRQLARIVLQAGPELPAMASVRITREWDFLSFRGAKFP
ncbi:HlyD family secretion protein [Loktanella sp. M215]|uniref:HlyD family secretion protein n=1 Tax=Loktanella sp. M215 TaxID=2675431 RepID=UPI001F34A8FB|nr:HlyD family efflux transporter periplasmic adaptor subunit [Loktanella sp. M215]